MTSYYDIKYRDVIYSEKEIGRQPIGKRMGMRMDKVCIFDLDGTLTNTLESLTFSVNETLKEMQLPKITSRQCRAFVGNGARVLMEKAITVSGKAHISRLDEAMEIYGRIFDENCTYHVIPYPGILSMLEALSREGIVLAVLSNKPHRQAVHVVEQIFGKERFQIVRGQQEGIPRKPGSDCGAPDCGTAACFAGGGRIYRRFGGRCGNGKGSRDADHRGVMGISETAGSGRSGSRVYCRFSGRDFKVDKEIGRF